MNLIESRVRIEFKKQTNEFLKCFFDSGLTYEILPKEEFQEIIDRTLNKKGFSDSCDGFYLQSINKIVLDSDNSEIMYKIIFFHEFVHYIRTLDPQFLILKSFGFMPNLLYKIYDKKFKGMDFYFGAEEMRENLIRWREEVVCDLISNFICVNLEKIERKQFFTMKPVFIYLVSGGFNKEDQINFKKEILKSCIETIEIINSNNTDFKIELSKFKKYFKVEYEYSEKTVQFINEQKNTKPIVSTYSQYSKRVFF